MENVKRGNYSRDEIIQRNTVLQFCLESVIYCWNSMNYFYEDADGSIQLFMEEPFHQNIEEIGRTRMISNHGGIDRLRLSLVQLCHVIQLNEGRKKSVNW